MAKRSKPAPQPARDLHGIDPDDATRALDADPSMDGLMAELSRAFGGNVKTEGWGEIENAGQAMQAQRAAMARQVKAEANIFRDTFMTPAGQKCLAIMRDMTVDTAPYPSEQFLPLDAITPLVIAHDAQCRFVRAIIQAIAQAENTEARQGTVT